MSRLVATAATAARERATWLPVLPELPPPGPLHQLEWSSGVKASRASPQGRLRLWAPTPAGEAAVWVACLVFQFAFCFLFLFLYFFFLSFSFFLILRWESPEVQVPGARERGGKNKMNNNEKKKKITPPSVPKACLCPSKW